MKIKEEWFNEFKDSNKWLEAQKEKDLDYYTDMYEAWQTKQQLVIGREVKPTTLWWSNYKIWSFTITTTGNKVITWVWFQPKIVELVGSDWINNMSIWKFTSSSSQRVVWANNAADESWSSDSNCLRVKVWVNNTIAAAVSLDTDGFTINVTSNSWTSYIKYTCIW